MKKKKNKILAFICTLAIAFCSVLGLNLINNVDNVSADAAETEITDLTGTRWYFNETIDFSAFNGDSYVAFDLDFALVSDGTSFITFGVLGGDEPYIRYDYLSGSSISVFRQGSWYGSKYRSVHITGGDSVVNAKLIAFFELNAVLVSSDPDPEDSSSSSSTPVDPEPEDSSSSSSEPVDPPEDSSSSSAEDDSPGIIVPLTREQTMILPFMTGSIVSTVSDVGGTTQALYLTDLYGLFLSGSQQSLVINDDKVPLLSRWSDPFKLSARSPSALNVATSAIIYARLTGYKSEYAYSNYLLDYDALLISDKEDVDRRLVLQIVLHYYSKSKDGTYTLVGSPVLEFMFESTPNTNVYYFPWFGYMNTQGISASNPISFGTFPVYGYTSLQYNNLQTAYAAMLEDYDYMKYNYDYAYNNGYEKGSSEGYSSGYKEGHRIAYDDGYAEGMLAANSFFGLMTAVVQAPVTVFVGLTDFEIFGYNMSSLAFSLLTAALIVCVIRLFTAGKS